MRSCSPPRVPCWLLEFILPVSYRQEMLGDLIEEYHFRTDSTSQLELSLWFWSHTCRSLPFLIWSSLRNGWLISMGVAVGVCAVMAMLKLAADWMIWEWIAPQAVTRVVLAPVVFLMKMAIGGYAAARIRHGATIFLALLVMITVAILSATSVSPTPLPWWYKFGFLTLGPATVLITPAVVRSLRPAAKRVV